MELLGGLGLLALASASYLWLAFLAPPRWLRQGAADGSEANPQLSLECALGLGSVVVEID